MEYSRLDTLVKAEESCNLCNTIHVEELSDMICPECSYQLQDELVPESDDVEDASEVVNPISHGVKEDPPSHGGGLL